MKAENRTAFDLGQFADALEKQLHEYPPGRHNSRKTRRRPSLFGGLEEWTADHEGVAMAALKSLAEVGDTSLVGRLLTTYDGALVSGDPSRLIRPLVMGPDAPGGARVGMFDAFTDRDAFIEALLGRPVPKRPRYRPDLRPRLDLRPGRGEAIDAVYARAAAGPAPSRALLARREIVEQTIDLGAQRLASHIAEHAPAAFDDLPIGALVRAAASTGTVARAVDLDLDFVTTFDCGVLGIVGFAWWEPGAPAFRRYRRPLAAHLRYLFDYRIAPWGRWTDPKRQDEVRRLLLGKEEHMPMRDFAAALRARYPERYAREDPSATARRLYRISAALTRERRAFAPIRVLLSDQ